ncbi:unnamed protein product [Oppiella nova]|uniref:Uncharacterized protein n=1 Tax=Oppiella nova TaxID=334625 RepID=A0A7R9LBR4_9ACAR|nr:unnamed protein product [Oppiella nova]CAG2161975.1 unnamed protein product [Oppiella nova]
MKLDAIELTAKLLIDLDEKIEKSLETDTTVKTVNKFSQLYIPPNENEIASVREEKFSEVLRDLAKMETQIQEAIRQAQVNRRYQLVARLRPLLNYVTHIRRNMDLLRNRMVAVTTLSTIAFTVNEVVDQFGDVMTSSFGMPGGVVVPGDRDRVAVNDMKLDAIELTAKLLIDLDEKIEKCLETDTTNEIASVREEKFSEVLRDSAKMETQIQEAIRQAQVNRRY